MPNELSAQRSSTCLIGAPLRRRGGAVRCGCAALILSNGAARGVRPLFIRFFVVIFRTKGKIDGKQKDTHHMPPVKERRRREKKYRNEEMSGAKSNVKVVMRDVYC